MPIKTLAAQAMNLRGRLVRQYKPRAISSMSITLRNRF